MRTIVLWVVIHLGRLLDLHTAGKELYFWQCFQYVRLVLCFYILAADEGLSVLEILQQKVIWQPCVV